MTGLILKDLLILRKALRSFLSVMVIYAALALAGVWPVEVLSGLMVTMVGILPMNVFAYDKQAKWDTYGLALPVGRTKTVAARYVCVLLLCLLSVGLTTIFGVVLYAAGHLEEPDTYVVSYAVCALLGLVTNAILLPLLYKFGPERARIMLIGFMGVIFAGIFLFFKVLGGVEWLHSLGKPTPAQIAAIPVAAVIAGAALLALSFLLSRHFYGQKDV